MSICNNSPPKQEYPDENEPRIHSENPYVYPISEDPHADEDCLTKFMRHIIPGDDV